MDEAFLNDLLECSVCLEQLDGNSKVLPCQHTFCKRCLEEIVNSHKELRCPECRVLVDTKVDDLPSNILLIRLLDGIKNNPRLKPSNSVAKRKEPSVPSRQLSPPRVVQTEHSMRQLLPVVSEHAKILPKQSLHTPPFAKAMFNYDGKEPGDLSFKKGDMIVLQRRIDQNWYHGEVNGKYGFVPARYVRVVIPLPTHVPQCKALYDFSVAENEEKDCLTFMKGEVITVIRRVDDNWAEGKSGDKIGIFPISFVEMNVAARSLMKLSVNSQPGPSRVAPPTPLMNSSQAAPHSKPSVTPPLKVPESLSSTTTTPSPSSSTTPSPSTPPSSNSSVPPTVSVSSSIVKLDRPCSVLKRSASQRTSHQREKRHSLSSISSSAQKSTHIPVTQKHSSEILSTSGGDVLAAPKRTVSDSPVSSTCSSVAFSSALVTTKNGVEDVSSRSTHRHLHRTVDVSKQSTTTTAAASTTATTTTVTTSKSTTSTTNSTPVVPPVVHVALYNYRPQKEDELELKKGEFYTVTEKCQDGWFKGTGLRGTKSGVFPGNYVHVASKSPSHPGQHGHQYGAVANVRSTGPKSLLPVANVPPRQKPPAVTQANPSTSNALTPAVYSFPGKPVPESMTPVAAGLLEWARSVTAAAGSQQKSQYMNASSKQQDPPKEGCVTSLFSSLSRPDSSHWSTDFTSTTATTTNSIIPQMSAMAISYPSAKVMHPHDLLPTGDDPSSISQSWHAGKAHGSAVIPPHAAVPSMAVMPPPNVSLCASSSGHSSHSKPEKHKVRKDKTRESLMKRFTGKRKTALPIPNFSCDNPSFVDSPISHSSGDIIHVRSGSCPSDLLTGPNSTPPQSSTVEVSNTDTPKLGSRLKQPSLVRERFRCVVPYPPNSEYELELKTGDIVYVHKKREDGWYKGTLLRTGKTGLFPATFVVSF